MVSGKLSGMTFDKYAKDPGRSGRKILQYIAALTASLSTFCTGTSLGWTAQIGPSLLEGDMGFPITDEELGWIGSFVPLGAAFLSVVSGSISDRIGRKVYMLSLALPTLVGWLLLVFANNIAMVYCGRFITGMTSGAFCLMTPLYTTEISQEDVRGTLGSFTQLMISFGILFTTIIGKFLDITTYTAICSTIPVIFGVLFLFMPESPTYLLKVDKESEARIALVRLRGTGYDIDSEIETIKLSLKQKSNISIKESLKTTATKRACVIAFGLMAFRVLCAVDSITAFASYIFKKADVDMDEKTSTIILVVIQTITGIFQSAVVDKVGRKILCVVSAFVMAICLGLVGLSFLLLNANSTSEDLANVFGYIPLVALCVFYVGYSLGLGPIPWMICGEIFPPEIKSIASSVANFTSWIFSFAIIKLFLIMSNGIGQDVTFFIFSGITFAGAVYIYIFVHETKGKTLAEIQEELGNKKTTKTVPK